MVTLAQPIDKKKKRPNIGGWLISEKLDGTRCFWDGGLTRGMKTKDVPWAGLLHPKTLEPKDKIKPYSTGLWSRYGNPIMAPGWFLDQLPELMLDGELWAGRGNFQLCRSIVAGDEADPRWDQIQYMIYGMPSLEAMTEPGLIKNANQYTEIPEEAFQDMLNRILDNDMTIGWATDDSPFSQALTELSDEILDNPYFSVHLQRYLSEDNDEAWTQADTFLEGVLAKGGEGAIIRNPRAVYETKRTHALLKYKNVETTEGILVGFTAGENDFEGLIGALILDYKGKRLKLSGMKKHERQMLTEVNVDPGKDMPTGSVAQHFKIGDVIEFAYRELSDDGIPKEARLLRNRGAQDAMA